MPNGTAQQWEESWRKSVDTRLSSVDVKLDALAESITVLKQVVGDMRDAKRAAPRLTQGWIDIGCMGIVVLVSMSALLISLIGLLSAHWH